jgi:hypothetical protein
VVVPHFPVLVVDTTAIVADYRLRTTEWQLVCAESSAGLRRVVVPEIVVREATNRFSTDLAKARTQIASANRVLRRLGVDTAQHIQDEDDAAGYEAWLRAKLTAAQIEIWPLPEDVLSGLVDRVIARASPIKSSGAGLGDALVWEAVRKACTLTSVGRVAFVSGNKSDFGDDVGQLRSELASEVVVGSDSTSAVLFPTVSDFVETQLVEDPIRHAAALNVVTQLLRDDRGSILECIRYAAYDAPVRVTDAISQAQFVPTEASEVSLLEVNVSRVVGLPEEWAVARFRATVRGHLELYGIAPHLNMGNPIHVDRVADFDMDFEAIIDLDEETLDNFASVHEIEVEFSDYATVW